jgi:hypothetical protein
MDGGDWQSVGDKVPVPLQDTQSASARWLFDNVQERGVFWPKTKTEPMWLSCGHSGGNKWQGRWWRLMK